MTKSQVEKFQDDLEEVVDRYAAEGMKQGAMVGTLEIVKLNLYWAGVEDEDEEE